MKSQSLLSGKFKKNISLSATESAQRVVKVNNKTQTNKFLGWNYNTFQTCEILITNKIYHNYVL